MLKVKDRVKELVWVDTEDVHNNPFNFRVHTDKQRNVFNELISEVGVAGAVLCRKTKEGKYVLIDGHMRKEELKGRKIPVLVVDLSEQEAKKLLAAYDAVSAMAEHDPKMFSKLVKEVETDGEALCSLFSELNEKGGKKSLKTEELELDMLEDDNEEEEEEGSDSLDDSIKEEKEGVESQVRMIQLFFNATTLDEFEGMSAKLGEEYKTSNITDTVTECMRRAVARKIKKTTTKV